MSTCNVQNCALKVSILIISLIASVNSQNENREGCSNLNEQCVKIEDCPSMYKLLNEYLKEAVPNLKHEFRDKLRQVHCGWEKKAPKVCCTNEGKEPTQELPNFDNNPILLKYTGIYLFPNQTTCGQEIYESKIIGGNETNIDEFPWMALLAIARGATQRFDCAGTLINNRYVITAAHCVHGQNLLSVRLGEWDTTNVTDCEQFGETEECNDAPVDVEIEKQIIHPYYNLIDHTNDIALLRLAKEISYTRWIKPICMPFSSQLRRNEYRNEKLTTAGWGRTESRLQRTVQSGKYHIKKQADVCWGLPGKDSCTGDSGGPLMSLVNENESKNWYLAGITSYGATRCATPDWPGIYTRVGPYIDWILSQVEQ